MKTFFSIFFLFFSQVSFCQNMYVQTSVQKMKYEYNYNGKINTEKYNLYQLSFHIQYFNFLESGIYTSIYPYLHRYTYQQKLQLFPLFSERQKFRFNTYLSGNISYGYISNFNKIIFNGYTFGIGSSLNVIKNWGIFGEYNFYPFYTNLKPYLQFGISYNWGKPKNE